MESNDCNEDEPHRREAGPLSLSGMARRLARRSRGARKWMLEAMTVYRRAAMTVVGWARGIDPDKVVFSSFHGAAYNDNPRYVCEALHRLNPRLKMVWLLRDPDGAGLPDWATAVKYGGARAMAELATAHAWVDNEMKHQSYRLRRDRQVYFHTWHGDRGFKRVGKDNDRVRFKPRTERFCDGMIAGSEFGARTYRTALEYRGEVLMDGCPRNDILLRNDPAEAAAVRRRLGVPEGTRLLIYAPTYRDDAGSGGQAAPLDLTATLNLLEKRTGGPWRALLRAHYRGGALDGGGDGRVMGATAWPEMAELLLVSDMLITDYSSCAGDFILLNRPAILYQPDADQYNRGSRDFYFDMADSPFFIARDMDGLGRIIDGLTEASVRENCAAWRAFFGVTETGHASEAAAEFLLKKMAEK